MFWPQSQHNNVLRTILGKAKAARKSYSYPAITTTCFANSTAPDSQSRDSPRVHHVGADGRRMLVLHGDEFDSVVQCSPWLASSAATFTTLLLRRNPYINWVRRKFDLPYWSLFVLPQKQGEEGGPIHRQLRRGVATAARKRASTRWFASYPSSRNARQSTASCTVMMEIGVESCTSLVEDMNGGICA